MVRTYLPRNIEDYKAFAAVEEVCNFKTVGGRILWANYKLLRLDFPFLEDFSNPQIDHWLLENYSSISERQFLLQGLRTTSIPTNQETQKAYRQRYHGRGDFMEVCHPQTGKQLGFIDRKGSGIHFKHLLRNIALYNKTNGDVETVRRSKKTNGLLYTGGALRELHMEVVERLLAEKSLTENKDYPGTVGNYAVLQLPFEIYHDGEGSSIPAGMVLRQANVGRVWFHRYVLGKEAQVCGASFLGDVVDGGSLFFYNSEKVPSFKSHWVKDDKAEPGKTGLPRYLLLKELVQEIVHCDSPQKVAQEHIDQLVEKLPIQREVYREEESLKSSLHKLLDKIIQSPEQYAAFLRTFHYLKRRENTHIVGLELIQQATRRVLNLADSYTSITGMGETIPTRSLALPMLVCLSQEEAKTLLEKELTNEDNKNQFKILAEYAWLFQYDEIKSVLPRLVEMNPHDFVQSLTTKLLEKDIREYPNFNNIQKMARFALENNLTRRWALEFFVQLVKEGGELKAPEFTGPIEP